MKQKLTSYFHFSIKVFKFESQVSFLTVLRSRLRIEARPTENDLTRLYKNGDISVVIIVASSNLVGRTSKWHFIIKFSLLLSRVLCGREIRPDAGKTTENEFVASFL